jgi:hypothetical protein
MGEESLVRASIPKSSWTQIMRSPPALKDKILAALGPNFESELKDEVTVTWVSFAVEAGMADGVFEALGPAGARAFYRAKTEHSFDIPVLKPIVTSCVRLFGASPKSMLKMLPRTWPSLSRNCGSYEFTDEGEERRGISIIKGFPTRFYRRREAWLESLLGGYEAFFAPFRVKGTVTVDAANFTAGSVRFILTW